MIAVLINLIIKRLRIEMIHVIIRIDNMENNDYDLVYGGEIMSKKQPEQLKKGEYYADYDYGIGRFAVYFRLEEYFRDDEALVCFDDEDKAVEYARQLNDGTLVLQ